MYEDDLQLGELKKNIVFFCLLFCRAEEAKKGRRVCCPPD